jgi:hypothetical protein
VADVELEDDDDADAAEAADEKERTRQFCSHVDWSFHMKFVDFLFVNICVVHLVIDRVYMMK